MIKTDYLVIGSGIAGLSYAIKMAKHYPDKVVAIVAKEQAQESNTSYAQGGMAVVIDQVKDSFEKHIHDTLIAGDGLCNEEVVNLVVTNAVERFHEVVSYGTEFDKAIDGSFDLGKEGGHSEHRVVHYKDITGKAIINSLLTTASLLPNLTIYNNLFVIDLITEHHFANSNEKDKPVSCYGAYALNKSSEAIETIVSTITMLATGGSGQVYRYTTNPKVSTGDGLAMAYRAKADVSNMEFIQFHPTALAIGDSNPNFLISEAVRGSGAHLINHKGVRFMLKYDERAELAPRDIVARCIDQEIKTSGENYVYLDCRHLDKSKFTAHFPNILEKCRTLGIDPLLDLIPVVPVAHYQCGGITVDKYSKTTVKGLLACGECANTGLHGANRLASNSLLEALVFAHQAFISTTENTDWYTDVKNNDIPSWSSLGTVAPDEMVTIKFLRSELRAIMSDLVGIVRSNDRLKLASDKMFEIYLQTKALYDTSELSQELCELRNLVNVAHIIIKQSKLRTENKGGYFNKDIAKLS